MKRELLAVLAIGLLGNSISCGWAAEPNVEQAKAVAEIQKLGGKITIDKNNPGKPVTAVRLMDTKVTDAGLEHFKGLRHLQSLELGNTTITDAGLEHLKSLTQLENLDLRGTKITDAGLEHLKGMTNLQSLYLSGTNVTDVGLEHLAGLTQLYDLDLGRTGVTHAGLIDLHRALPRCHIRR